MRKKTSKQYVAVLLCLVLLIAQIPIMLGDANINLAALHHIFFINIFL